MITGDSSGIAQIIANDSGIIKASDYDNIDEYIIESSELIQNIGGIE